jgi:hypothetical protein
VGGGDVEDGQEERMTEDAAGGEGPALGGGLQASGGGDGEGKEELISSEDETGGQDLATTSVEATLESAKAGKSERRKGVKKVCVSVSCLCVCVSVSLSVSLPPCLSLSRSRSLALVRALSWLLLVRTYRGTARKTPRSPLYQNVYVC